ncbi:MAG: rhodanese-like domain-containing protein [Saprospiraceae bacterium]|nr:rhodanese-like domain-containing protein [Saprospiraceae bacterium]
MDDITVNELKKRLDAGEKLVFIDVREPHEYAEFNLGAKLIPLGTLPDALEGLSKYKDTEIVVHCRSGARSGQAQIFMRQFGFTKVRNLIGGVLAWQREFGG